MNNSQVLAVVGTVTITRDDVARAIMALGPRGESFNTPQGQAEILQQLIEQALFLTDAKKTMLEYDPTFKKQLQKLKDDLLVQFSITRAIEKVNVTDIELKSFYDDNPQQFAPQPMAHASHILVDSEEKASDILEKINSGSITFEDAAREYSSCPSSQNGGDLGTFGPGQMVPEFDEACFSMEPGELRGPVKTQFGFHIIRLDEKTASDPVSFEQAKDAIREHLLNEKRRKTYTSRVNQLKIMYPVQMG